MISSTYMNLLVKANELAATSDISKGKLCAFILDGKKIVAYGVNNSRTCYGGRTQLPCHAEEAAIYNLMKHYNVPYYRRRQLVLHAY